GSEGRASIFEDRAWTVSLGVFGDGVSKKMKIAIMTITTMRAVHDAQLQGTLPVASAITAETGLRIKTSPAAHRPALIEHHARARAATAAPARTRKAVPSAPAGVP